MEYNKELCDERHEELRRSSDAIFSILEQLRTTQTKIEDALFRDNGRPSYQSRLNKIEGWVKLSNKTVLCLAVPVLLNLVREVTHMIFKCFN